MAVFCDWITLAQLHPRGGLPIINGGHAFGVDPDGVVDWQVSKRQKVEGSYSTKVEIRCDGDRVTLSGNVGRFNRQDNVFGYSVWECVQIANQICASFGLPPFTVGHTAAKFRRLQRSDNTAPEGAVITRLDLTRNYTTGSQADASRLCNFLAGQSHGRKSAQGYGASGVTWGEGSKYWYAKFYNKFLDLEKHGCDNEQLKAWVRDVGLVRHEVSLKSRYLTQQGLRELWVWVENEGLEMAIYKNFDEVLRSNSVAKGHFEDLPRRLGEVAIAWRDGIDLRERYSKATFYRYRRLLRGYGIDIAYPCNVTRLSTRINVIDCAPAVRPAWYSLPALAA